MEVLSMALLLAALTTTTFFRSAGGSPSLPRDFPCTKEEHECLSLGRVLDAQRKQCYKVADVSSCTDSKSFHVNKYRLLAGGPLVGECTIKPCNHHEVLTMSGRCETFFQFQKKTCNGVGHREKYFNVFGEAVCSPITDSKELLHSAPPYGEYNGRCTLPTWLSPVPGPKYVNLLVGVSLPRIAEELRCYHKQEVLVNGVCWPLRERGPCAEGEWLVLDVNKIYSRRNGYLISKEARITPACKPRLCPKGLYVPVDGRAAGRLCVHPADVRRRFCGSLEVVVDVLGRIGCGDIKTLDNFVILEPATIRFKKLNESINMRNIKPLRASTSRTEPVTFRLLDPAESRKHIEIIPSPQGKVINVDVSCAKDNDEQCKSAVSVVATQFVLKPED